MNAFLRYTVLRLMIFAGCLLVLWLLGLRDDSQYLLLVVLAALLSMAVSYVALRRFREAYSAELAATIERRTAARREREGERPTDEDAEDTEIGGGRPGAAPADEGDFR